MRQARIIDIAHDRSAIVVQLTHSGREHVVPMDAVDLPKEDIRIGKKCLYGQPMIPGATPYITEREWLQPGCRLT